MKKNNIWLSLDEKVDEKVKPFWAHYKNIFPVFSAGILIFLFLFLIIKIFYDRPYFMSSLIYEDMNQIAGILTKIDKDCDILNLNRDRVYVDFLTVEKFVGSEVGGLNLVHPENWHGPYLRENPVYEGKYYEIVKTKEGYFLIPGFGSKLPNGLVYGKDFIITYDSSILNMLKDKGQLNYKEHPLALQLKFEIGDWQLKKINSVQIDKVNKMVEEFNAAMPFTHNQTSQFKC